MQLGIDRRFAFGIGVGIGIEFLCVSLAFLSLAEAKGAAEVFDNRGINIKLLPPETHTAPFDSESDSDPDPDRISLRQK